MAENALRPRQLGNAVLPTLCVCGIKSVALEQEVCRLVTQDPLLNCLVHCTPGMGCQLEKLHAPHMCRGFALPAGECGVL